MKNNGIPKLERLVGARLVGGFHKFARTVVRTSGHPMAFGLAIGIIVIWALTGPLFRFGNTWLLVINTVASIITFLMIFLIRNAQNRESEAVQLKLDELIRATKEAQNTLLDIEELSQQAVHAHGARHEPNRVRSPPASQTPKTASPPLPRCPAVRPIHPDQSTFWQGPPRGAGRSRGPRSRGPLDQLRNRW